MDVVINTPADVATLANGYTYLENVVGQSSGGGKIACLNEVVGNNLTKNPGYNNFSVVVE